MKRRKVRTMFGWRRRTVSFASSTKDFTYAPSLRNEGSSRLRTTSSGSPGERCVESLARA